MAKKKKNKTRFSLRDLNFLWQIAMILVLAFVLVTFIGSAVKIDSESMAPSVTEGQYVLTSKLFYHRFEILGHEIQLKSPGRGDMLLYSKDGETKYIGRVVGLPGDTVAIDAETGAVTVNSIPYAEAAGSYAPGEREYPVQLGAGEYFLLCDSSEKGPDSRSASVANVSASEIEGKLLFVIWPFEAWGLVK